MMMITQISFKGFAVINEKFKFLISKSMHKPVIFKTFIMFQHIAKGMLLKEILHYFIFHFYVKITKNDKFFIPSSIEF